MSSFTLFFAEPSILKSLELPSSDNSALGETIKIYKNQITMPNASWSLDAIKNKIE